MNVVNYKRRAANDERLLDDNDRVRVAKYDRSVEQAGAVIRSTSNKVLKSTLRREVRRTKEAAIEAARTELLMTEDAGMLVADADEVKRTGELSERELAALLPAQAADKMIKLDLQTHAPYSVDLTRDGRYMAIGGERGHVAMMDRLTMQLRCELFVNEAVRDVQFLHNHTMFAAAQRKYTYIYDADGIELHCMRQHIDINCLEFLPFHFLLCSVGNAGFLSYHDVSTGQLVAQRRTKLGACHAMRQNPSNAVLHLGHKNGTVTLWTPNLKQAAVTLFTGPGAVQTVAVDARGQCMAVGGASGYVNVFDLRTYKSLYSYRVRGAISSLDFSQRGVLAVGFGTRVHMFAPPVDEPSRELYLNHHARGAAVKHVRFAAYDDVLCVGHARGVTCTVVPGAGEPNFDSYVASPYETAKQRREREVQSLLEKLQPSMITLESNVFGKLRGKKRMFNDYDGLTELELAVRKQNGRPDDASDDESSSGGDEASDSASDSDADADDKKRGKRKKRRSTAKGKNRAGRVAAHKDQAFQDQHRAARRAANYKQRLRDAKRKKREAAELESAGPQPVLSRFARKAKR